MATLFMHNGLFALFGELPNGKPVRWVLRSPAVSHAAMAALLCLSAASARADMLPSLVWNCWASGQNPDRINCIHKREQLAKFPLSDLDSELEAQILGQLQEKNAMAKRPGWKV